MNKSSSNAGFGILELFLAIATVALLALIGWMAYRGITAKPATTATTGTKSSSASTQAADSYAGWKTYSNQDGGMTFRFPANWSSQVEQEIKYDDGSFGGVSGSLTSPSGHKLTWVYNVIGGKGDAICTPAANDVPFAAQNKCASKQILSVEKIPSVKPIQNTLRNLFEDELYITETKYRAGLPDSGQASDITYQICLDPFFDSDSQLFPKVGTAMGFELPCEYWDTGFNAEFHANNQADLSSADAQTAKLIMRSFGTI